MVTGGDDAISTLFGSNPAISISRGLAECHARRPVMIAGADETLLVLPVEGLDSRRLPAFAALCAPERLRLVIAARRAQALGIPASAPVALALAADCDADAIVALASAPDARAPGAIEPAGATGLAAIELMKLAQMLPAVLTADASSMKRPIDVPITTVAASAVATFRDHLVQSLTMCGEARVPVDAGVQTRFVVFRDMIGASHVAVIVGNPDMTKPVPVRLHSACLTGDVFGSRRCDCGEQLRSALPRLAADGGGIILYLPQEGRGLGISSKLRAYELQDAGLDTVDANTTLGFDDDERDYAIAARILTMLGCARVVLLTNNPAKLGGLADAGITIVGRQPLEMPTNPDNRRYMTAKAARSGHHLEHLIAALADTSGTKPASTPVVR